MAGKLILDLLITATSSITYAYFYSSAVSIGSDNGAMIEGWITSIGGSINATDGVEFAIEGSNDGTNFDTTAIVSVNTDTTATAPQWLKSAGSGVTPYSWLRVRVGIKHNGASATALVSASIRTYQAA